MFELERTWSTQSASTKRTLEHQGATHLSTESTEST